MKLKTLPEAFFKAHPEIEASSVRPKVQLP
jgi:hypothetical protein